MAQQRGEERGDEPGLGDASRHLRDAERQRQRKLRTRHLRFAPEESLRGAVRFCRRP
jgi:hypothetical protein